MGISHSMMEEHNALAIYIIQLIQLLVVQLLGLISTILIILIIAILGRSFPFVLPARRVATFGWSW